MSDDDTITTPPPSPPKPPAPAAKLTPQGCLYLCLGIIALMMIIGWLADRGGGSAKQPATPNLMSKAQWRAKYASSFGQNPIVTVVKFKAVFGEPSSSQTVGNDAYWYYGCSDGTIQAVLNDPRLFGNAACVQHINDY